MTARLVNKRKIYDWFDNLSFGMIMFLAYGVLGPILVGLMMLLGWAICAVQGIPYW